MQRKRKKKTKKKEQKHSVNHRITIQYMRRNTTKKIFCRIHRKNVCFFISDDFSVTKA